MDRHRLPHFHVGNEVKDDTSEDFSTVNGTGTAKIYDDDDDDDDDITRYTVQVYTSLLQSRFLCLISSF
jgi:hypothetical protein